MGTETPACFGCLLNPGYTWPSGPQPYIGVMPAALIVLTFSEKEVLRLLAESWNQFTALDKKSDSDKQEFMDAIHRCQQIIALRVARRVDSNIWKQPE